ncbi:MAG: glycosyltransferase family 2 protein, partial [Chloroflexota bacterium]
MAEKWGKVVVVIPALNEAENIGDLVRETRAQPILRERDPIIVVDNGSTDDTATVALEAGAIVVSEPRRGYGAACAAGAAAASDAEVIVFLDGDYSSLPVEIHRLLEPIQVGNADLVLGSRTRGTIAKGSMPPHQRFGNWLTSRLMQQLYHIDVTDLGPYRAIRK